MRWYRVLRLRCPACARRLAVEAAQVRRHEVVVCPGCNAAIRLAPARGPGALDAPVDDRRVVRIAL